MKRIYVCGHPYGDDTENYDGDSHRSLLNCARRAPQHAGLGAVGLLLAVRARPLQRRPETVVRRFRLRLIDLETHGVRVSLLTNL